ncbi:hypothetical protein [Encephalitozoon cuniculi GB-M1]|uniref:Uncharacterized protein n=1 Tax=Encephalitozoon cuniculi (strain GB-M1) TaxID=284813 RepID=Q8SV37_ENCCU|nr:uncharacterized protein ECU07_0300 [Encephalitozoon cuniculi GB-M1]CAD25562.1 hypothetical protein [Encephalitozoon cuniculi GB-M1]
MRDRSNPYPLLKKRCVKVAGTGKLGIGIGIKGMEPSVGAQGKPTPSTREVKGRSGAVDGTKDEKVAGHCIRGCSRRVAPREYDGFPMDAFLASIFGQEKGSRLNFGLINSVILRFLDHKSIQSILPIESIFRLAKGLPLTLISGYIYLEKYVKRVRIVFGDCKKLIKFFLVCCFMGSKFIYDTQSPDDLLLREMDVTAREAFYIESLVLSVIDYDVEISNSDIRKVILRNRIFLGDKRRLNVQFDEAIGRC